LGSTWKIRLVIITMRKLYIKSGGDKDPREAHYYLGLAYHHEKNILGIPAPVDSKSAMDTSDVSSRADSKTTVELQGLDDDNDISMTPAVTELVASNFQDLEDFKVDADAFPSEVLALCHLDLARDFKDAVDFRKSILCFNFSETFGYKTTNDVSDPLLEEGRRQIYQKLFEVETRLRSEKKAKEDALGAEKAKSPDSKIIGVKRNHAAISNSNSNSNSSSNFTPQPLLLSGSLSSFSANGNGIAPMNTSDNENAETVLGKEKGEPDQKKLRYGVVS